MTRLMATALLALQRPTMRIIRDHLALFSQILPNLYLRLPTVCNPIYFAYNWGVTSSTGFTIWTVQGLLRSMQPISLYTKSMDRGYWCYQLFCWKNVSLEVCMAWKQRYRGERVCKYPWVGKIQWSTYSLTILLWNTTRPSRRSRACVRYSQLILIHININITLLNNSPMSINSTKTKSRTWILFLDMYVYMKIWIR